MPKHSMIKKKVVIKNLFVVDMRMFCCKGFCMDLLRELAKTINFTYNLTLSPDGQFGSYINRNSSGI